MSHIINININIIVRVIFLRPSLLVFPLKKQQMEEFYISEKYGRLRVVE